MWDFFLSYFHFSLNHGESETFLIPQIRARLLKRRQSGHYTTKRPFPDNTGVRPLQTQTLSPQGSLWFRQTCISIAVCVWECVWCVVCAPPWPWEIPPSDSSSKFSPEAEAFSVFTSTHTVDKDLSPTSTNTVLQVSCWIIR